MDLFFGKMGIKGLRYKPAYNPCMHCPHLTLGMHTDFVHLDTEPSMEIFSYRMLYSNYLHKPILPNSLENLFYASILPHPAHLMAMKMRTSAKPSRHYHYVRNANTPIPDAGLGKSVEIGNSGMFRPEMLEAMGLP